MSGLGELVCGFGDEVTALAGVAWHLGGSTGGVLCAEGSSAAAEAEIEDRGDSLRLTLTAGGTSAEIAFSPRARAASLPGAEGGRPSALLCTATARVAEGDAGGEIECRGQITRWEGDPAEGAGILRHLSIPAAEGSLILVISRGPGDDHASEATGAWLIDPERGASAFGESLLSTQYDASGGLTRAGLELWPAADSDAPPTRAAGTTVGAAAVGEGAISAALMRTSAEGSEGLGSYLLWRA